MLRIIHENVWASLVQASVRYADGRDGCFHSSAGTEVPPQGMEVGWKPTMRGQSAGLL
jgi:hypothetical protein